MSWDDDIRARFSDWGTDAALARWPSAKASLAIGETVRGDVFGRAPFGVWVDIAAGNPALLLVPEMAGACQRPVRFEDYPELGAVVEAWVVSLGERAEITLSQSPKTVEYT
jgi:predicted RNA-binding protein with RPS1 domain